MKANEILSLINASLDALNMRLSGGESNKGNPRVEAMRREGKPFYLGEAAAKYLAQTRVDLSAIFPASGNINPTVPYRFAQFVNALQVGDFKNIDLTTARSLIALREAGGTLNRDALFSLLTGKQKTEGISPNTRGIGLTQLDKLVGRIGKGSVETQLSRSYGANGFCKALGMVTTDGRSNFSVSVNPENLFVKRFYALIDAATANQLESMGNKKGDE